MSTPIVTKLQRLIAQNLKSSTKDDIERAVLRMLLAGVLKDQIDSGKEVDQSRLLFIVDKMVKQRRESISHYQVANRLELVGQEQAEINFLTTHFLPPPLSSDAVVEIIDEAILKVQAKCLSDMGKVMAILKKELVGQADMSAVNDQLRKKLSV